MEFSHGMLSAIHNRTASHICCKPELESSAVRTKQRLCSWFASPVNQTTDCAIFSSRLKQLDSGQVVMDIESLAMNVCETRLTCLVAYTGAVALTVVACAFIAAVLYFHYLHRKYAHIPSPPRDG